MLGRSDEKSDPSEESPSVMYARSRVAMRVMRVDFIYVGDSGVKKSRRLDIRLRIFRVVKSYHLSIQRKTSHAKVFSTSLSRGDVFDHFIVAKPSCGSGNLIDAPRLTCVMF